MLNAWLATTLVIAAAQFPAPEDLPVTEGLPDPFVRGDGYRLIEPWQWKEHRQALVDIVTFYEYGHMPAPVPVAVEGMSSQRILGGKGIEYTFKLAIGENFRLQCGLITPAAGSGPFPTVLAIDPAWHEHNRPTAKLLVERGYAYAGFVYHEVDNDDKNKLDHMYPHFPGYDWGTLAAWAWAAMRLTDYLVTNEHVDKEKLVITGHSRTGKAALWAGALDERIALVAPHSSGTGGAGALRITDKGGESLAWITSKVAFHYWFHPRLAEFAGEESRLPFDQHFVKALVAPRGFLSLEAKEDLWSNPLGTQQTHLAAQEVYRFLEAEDKIAYWLRDGGHDMVLEDWAAMLDFADHLFFEKPLPQEGFNQLPYPDLEPAFTWRAPGTEEESEDVIEVFRP
jgi:dienelactone hydrolase